MKLIYNIIFFMLFVNIFIPLVSSLGIFANEYTGNEDYYKIENSDNLDRDKTFEDVTGIGFGAITSMDFVALARLGGALLVAVGLAYAFHSPAPVAVALFLVTFINVYERSESIAGQFAINPYIIFAFGMGILFLFIITMIELFTHGDASDS